MLLLLLSASIRGCMPCARLRAQWSHRSLRITLPCMIALLLITSVSAGTARDGGAPSPERIAAVTLSSAAEVVTVRRDREAWQIVAPLRTAANHTAVSQLIDAITTCVLPISAVPSAPVPDAHDPQLTLRLHLRDGTMPSPIHIGSTTGHGIAPWLRYEDAPTAVALTADCFQHLHVDLRTLRSMVVVPLPVDAIVQIAVHGSGVGTTVVRDGEAWQMQLPTVGPADRERIQTFLAQLTSLTARATIDQPAAALRLYRLAPASFTVTLSTQDGQTQTVMFGHGRGTGSTATQWYARRPHDETILQLDHAPLDQWATTLVDLRDLRLLVSEHPEAIRVLHLMRPGESDMTVLRQPDGQWTLAGPRRAPVDPAAVGRLVTTLTSLRGTSIVADPAGNLATYGLTQPDLTIRAVDGQGVLLGTVMLTRPDAQGQRPSYGMRQGGARVLAFEPWIYEALNLHTSDGRIRARAAGDTAHAESWADAEETPAAPTPPGRLRSITRSVAEQ